jgi:hypothetical protein
MKNDEIEGKVFIIGTIGILAIFVTLGVVGVFSNANQAVDLANSIIKVETGVDVEKIEKNLINKDN